MIPLQVVAIALVAAFALALVLTHDLVRLAIVASVYGFTLVVLFVLFQAPDVALSELVVGGVAFPLVIVVAIVMQRGQ